MNTQDYDKAVLIIRNRQEYNKQYYAKRKEQTETKNKSGRKIIDEITLERAEETLSKYKIKCQKRQEQRQVPLNTIDEIKAEINRLFVKLKTLMPDTEII